MAARCRFCGQKIKLGAEVCEHCGKTLISKPEQEDRKLSPVGISSWEQKSIPAWIMYLVVGLALFCVMLMLTRGCENSDDEDAQKQKPASTNACLILPQQLTRQFEDNFGLFGRWND